VRTGIFLTNAVSSDIWSAGASIGWGSGVWGIRGEVMGDWRGDRGVGGTLSAPTGGRLNTSIETATRHVPTAATTSATGAASSPMWGPVGVARNEMDDYLLDFDHDPI
jgi:hypothetical protein